MRKGLFLCCALLCMPQLALSDGYLAIVHDFSQPPMGKFFSIQHLDHSKDQLYLETGLREGDAIVFPSGLKKSSTAWVEVQLNGEPDPIKIFAKDSPWKLPINTKQGVIGSFSTTSVALYAYMFKGESKVRYTQAMSRGFPKAEALSLPLSIAGTNVVNDHDSPLKWFWVGGTAPFTLQVVCGDTKHRIQNYTYKADSMFNHTIRFAILPSESARCVAGLVHYYLVDKTGATLSFDVLYVGGHQPSTEEMIRTLDQQPLLGEGMASQRLMLWNVAWQLPETSSKRAMLLWMLINGEIMNLPKKQ